MQPKTPQTVCWVSTWSANHFGLEHVLLAGTSANSSLLAFDENGEPFRLAYRLRWDDRGLLRQADLETLKGTRARSLTLQADGCGCWLDGQGERLSHLDGCIDIDIWPTPLTNSFPIWRSNMEIGQRQDFLMAWVSAPDLTIVAKRQAYTRLAEHQYLFESLDGTGFTATLPFDDFGLVTDYPELFRRVANTQTGAYVKSSSHR